MAKFFRFIVNLCIICFLLTGVALIAPQFAGITTVIVDGDITDTNQNAGSVVYGRSVSLEELEVGDKLLRSTNTSVYVSEIKTADATAGVYTVEGKDGADEEVTLRGSADKVLITVPFIGYVSIAMQTFEGRIILGLALAFLIILFILSEIWKNNEEDEEDDEEEDEEEDEDELPENLSRKERKARKKEEKRRRKLEKQGTVEDEEEEITAEKPEETEEVEKPEDAEIEEFVLEPADELEEEENEEVSEGEDDMVDVDLFTAAIQAALESEADHESEEEISAEQSETVEETPVKVEEPEEPKKLAIPTMTKEEILEKARADGDDPKVIEDEEDGIVFIDYSDVL